jgi:hypothetical protein
MPLSEKTPFADEILFAVLAATDAVFVPDRDPTAHSRHVVIYERRRDFPHFGIPWASEKVLPGLDDAGRKQVQRSLEHLAAIGMVETIQPKAVKTLGVRLTDAGDAHVRALAGLPSLVDAMPVVRRIHDLLSDDIACQFLGRVWIPETALASVRWGDNDQRHKLVEFEELSLPALVRGYAVSNCTVQGHCWYTITPAGLDVIKSPPTAHELPIASIEARREYYSRIHLEIRALSAAKPDNEREIGEIPMPVCPLPAKESVA